jgi:hypothetical protein
MATQARALAGFVVRAPTSIKEIAAGADSAALPGVRAGRKFRRRLDFTTDFGA